jgi:hypothetical protein
MSGGAVWDQPFPALSRIRSPLQVVEDVLRGAPCRVVAAPLGELSQGVDLEAQRIGTAPGDQRLRQSMSLAVSKNVTARAN